MKSCLGILLVFFTCVAVIGGGALIWYLSRTAEFSRTDATSVSTPPPAPIPAPVAPPSLQPATPRVVPPAPKPVAPANPFGERRPVEN